LVVCRLASPGRISCGITESEFEASEQGIHKMAEKCYGRIRVAYVVTERKRRSNGRIEIFVFHEAKAVRRDLENKSPSRLLRQYDAFKRSNITAQKWLARVMEDYRSWFEEDLVDFTFITFKRPGTTRL